MANTWWYCRACRARRREDAMPIDPWGLAQSA